MIDLLVEILLLFVLVLFAMIGAYHVFTHMANVIVKRKKLF